MNIDGRLESSHRERCPLHRVAGLPLENSINQRKDRCESLAVQQEYALTNSVYKVAGAAGKFQIVQSDSAPQTFAAVKAALGLGSE